MPAHTSKKLSNKLGGPQEVHTVESETQRYSSSRRLAEHGEDSCDPTPMRIDERLKQLRTRKGLTQSDIEERTGLSRTYVSAVENGHTVPAIETLEKFARALEVPMYVLFYDGMEPPEAIPPATKESIWGDRGKEAPSLARLRRELGKTSLRQRKLLLDLARKLTSRAR